MWDKIENIYNKLQDEESKFIFRKRLEYSLCNECIESIFEIATKEYDSNNGSLYSMIKNINEFRDKNIIVFGAGYSGFIVLSILRFYKIKNIVALCDNDIHLYSQIKYGIKVISPEEAYQKYRDAVWIIASVSHFEEMRCQLLECGVKNKNIFYYQKGEQVYGKQYFDKRIIKSKNDGVFIDGGCCNLLRICHEINFHFGLSKSAYASLSSIGVPKYASFLRLAYTDLYCAKIKSYFMTAPKYQAIHRI